MFSAMWSPPRVIKTRKDLGHRRYKYLQTAGIGIQSSRTRFTSLGRQDDGSGRA